MTPSAPSQNNAPHVALVIGSGGVKCAAALGLQRVLEREGIEVDLVVGCSGGALYAAAIALGWKAQATIDITKRLWTREVTSKRRWRSMLSIVLPGLFGFNPEFGLLDDRLALDRLRQAFGDRRIEETGVPLRVVATNFADGAQVVMSEGLLVDALRASIALPYIFSPWRVNGQLLADGYLSDPMPVGVAIQAGAGVILAMGFTASYQTRIDSLPRFAFQLSSIMSNNLFRANYAFHTQAHHSEIISVIPEFGERVRLFDTGKLDQVIEAGERAMEAQLGVLRQALAAE